MKILALGGLILFVVVIGVVLSSSNTKASSSVDRLNWTLPVSCTMNSTIASGSKHTATLMSGEYIEDIGTTTVTVICNDSGGLSVYTIGDSGDVLGSTDLISSVNTDYNIHTGVYSSGNSNSSWSMKLANVSGAQTLTPVSGKFGSYIAVPDTWTKIAYRDASTGTTGGSSFTATYDVYANNTQIASSYNGQVKYVVVHPEIMVAGDYTIVYNANGGTGTMQSETIPNYEPHTLATNAFIAPTGYDFVGWCTIQNTNQVPQTACSGESFTDSATLPASPIAAATSGETLNLYAYWRIPPTMQQFAAGEAYTNCSDMNVNDVITLLDARDNQSYTVAKLADHKCWMTKNLNLSGNILLFSDTTDFESSYTLPTDQGWQSDGKLPVSSTDGFDTFNYAYIYNSNSEICGDNSPCYSYYSWDVATLGSGRDITVANQNAPYSICPKGWHLPSTYYGTDSSTDFRALAIAYGGSDTVYDYNYNTSPIGDDIYSLIGPGTISNFLPAGTYSYGEFGNGGTYTNYWSSTISDFSDVKIMYHILGYMGFAGNAYRAIGVPVRCLASE